MSQSMVQIIRVTRPRPRPSSGLLFVCYDKSKVCSFTHFGDMFEGETNFIRVTWLRLGTFLEVLFVCLQEIVHMHLRAKFQVCSFTHFGDMFEGVSNFIRVTWPTQSPFSGFLFPIFEKLSICICVANFKSHALLVLAICLRVCQIL